jgi:hypothetical protein
MLIIATRSFTKEHLFTRQERQSHIFLRIRLRGIYGINQNGLRWGKVITDKKK